MDAPSGPPRTVGIVGDDGRVSLDGLAASVSTVRGTAETVLEASPDVIVGAGTAALQSLARHQPDATLLPVDAGPGLRSLPATAVADALSQYQSDTWKTTPYPLLAVAVDGEARGTALFDVTLVAAEPARIAAFSIGTPGEPVGRVRADGVVAATPAGTSGYARAIGAPRVSPEAPVTVVAPIAPFTTDPETWVLADPITVTVERDETPVTVLADDDAVATVGVGTRVTVEIAGTVDIASVPASPSAFAREGGKLEKH